MELLEESSGYEGYESMLLIFNDVLDQLLSLSLVQLQKTLFEVQDSTDGIIFILLEQVRAIAPDIGGIFLVIIVRIGNG